MRSDTSLQIAYGRVVRELGLVPEAQLRALGQACLEQGLDLRQHLLTQGHVSAEDDARILQRMQREGTATTEWAQTEGERTKTRLPKRLPRAGEQFAGCLVEQELARGGAGAVFIARRADGSKCALKVLMGDLSRHDRRERFEREVAVGQRLGHPGIVRIFEHGEDRGLAYLTMELLENALPLDDYVERHQVPLQETAQLVIQVAEAVQAAHDEGVIHRDLKPDNVLVLPGGEVKVVDFGLARDVDRQRLTQSGAVMGTLHYMAPEQVRGDTAHADARTDVYALGVMLYRLTTGELPFDGDTAVEVMRAVIEDPAPDIRDRVAELPGVADVVAMALRKANDDRYPSAAAFARDLVAVCSGSGVASAAARDRARRRRGRVLALLGGLTILVGLGVGAVMAWDAVRSGPLSREEAKREADSLKEEADDLVRDSSGSAADLGDRIEELDSRLEALESRSGDEQDVLEPAQERITALTGLLALVRGDRAKAEAALRRLGDSRRPVVCALRGGLLAQTPSADAEQACAELDRAVENGVGWVELRGWRVQARERTGVGSTEQGQQVLDDLEAVGEQRPLSDAERALKVRALVALERIADAHQLLQDLPEADVDLRWSVALAQAAKQVEEDPALAITTLEKLPPTQTEDPVRDQLATRVLELMKRPVRELSKSREAGLTLSTLLRLYGLVAPHDSLPEPTVSRILKTITGWGYKGAFEPAVALADVMPNDREVQRAVGMMSQRRRPGIPVRNFLRALKRAVEIEDDAKELQTLRILLCFQLARKNDTYLGRGKLDEEEARLSIRVASAMLEGALSDKDRGDVLMSRSRMLRRLGDLEDSLRDANEAIDVNSAPSDYRLFRGLTFQALGKREAAITDLAFFVINAVDNSADRLHALVSAWDLARELKQLDRLLKCLLSLVNDRDLPGWRVRGAWLQLRNKDVAGALASLEKAVPMFAKDDSVKEWRKEPSRLIALVREQGAAAEPELAKLVQALDGARKPGKRYP